LGKSRSSKVGFVLAHHDFEEITKEVLSSVYGNVNTFIVFRCGDREGERMANLFGLKTNDFLNLKKYNAWVRIGIDNTLIETNPPILEEVPEIDLPKIIKQEIKEPYFLSDDPWIMLK
jgi:hypothetical protein